jgi:hypothetical protein
MTDPFERGREQAEARRRELEAFREDVRAMVSEEVGRTGVSESDLKRMVRDLVRAEAGTAAPRERAAPVMVWVAVAAVVGLLGGALGYRALAGTPGESMATEQSAPAPVVDVADTPPTPAVAQAPPTPAERAARWDSLVAARSPVLDPLLAQVEAAGPAAPVRAALEAWRGGAALDAAAARRFHDALVQLTLNDVAGAGLALDGLVTRAPCRGDSCGALLRVWQERGEALGMPAYPADPANDAEALRIAERALLFGRVEDQGG